MVSFGKEDSSSVSTPTKVDIWNDEQKALFRQLFSLASGGMSTPTTSYPRQMYVDRTPEEQAYFDAINQVYSPGNIDARSQAVNQVLSGKPSYEIDPAKTEQFYQEGIKPGYMKEWEDITLPAIKESFVGPGYWGSARANAQATGAENLATTLATKRAELMYADEQARRAALESAAGRQAGMAGSATNTLTGATSDLGTAGQYARTIAQEKVTADLQRWLMGESVDGAFAQQYNPYIQLALAMMGLTPFAIANQTESESSGFNFGIKLPK